MLSAYYSTLATVLVVLAVVHRQCWFGQRKGILPVKTLTPAIRQSWLVFYGTFSTNKLYRATEVGNVSHRAGGQHKYHAVKQ